MNLKYKFWVCLPFIVSALSCYGYYHLHKKIPGNPFFFPELPGIVGLFYFAHFFVGFLFSIVRGREIDKKELNIYVIGSMVWSLQPLAGIIILVIVGIVCFLKIPIKI